VRLPVTVIALIICLGGPRAMAQQHRVVTISTLCLLDDADLRTPT